MKYNVSAMLMIIATLVVMTFGFVAMTKGDYITSHLMMFIGGLDFGGAVGAMCIKESKK